MRANLALIQGALGRSDLAFAIIRQGEAVELVKPEEKAILKVAAAILFAQQGKAGEAVEYLKNSGSKYYTAAEAALDPRLKSIAGMDAFKAYLKG